MEQEKAAGYQRGSLTAVAAGGCVKPNSALPILLAPLYKVAANLQHIKCLGHSLAEGRQV